MNENERVAVFKTGKEAAYRSMYLECMRNLPGMEHQRELLAERCEVIAKLRGLCSKYGDNDWPDELHLWDIIEVHLLRHMGANQ